MEGTSMDDVHIAPRERDLPVETVVSVDGTPIAVERSGAGPPVVMIGGALNDRAMFTILAEELSRDFTVFNYDRRGRGRSGDGDREKYTVDLEVADLRAVLAVAGDSCFVFANCTGGMVAIPAAAGGVPMAKLALYEPPYSPRERSQRPQAPADYLDRLIVLLAADRRGDAVALFQKEAVGLPDEVIDRIRQHPAWPWLEYLAPSLVYDCIIGLDPPIPFDQLARITVPTLVLDGGESPVWQQTVCEDIARAVPGSRHTRVPGDSHIFDDAKVAGLLAAFFSGHR